MWGRRCSWGSLVRIRAEFQWEGKSGTPAGELGAVGALFSLYKLEESPLQSGRSAAL